jgi:hypothetical protein
MILFHVFAQSNAWALPNFARKYNVSCTLCHSAVPRLTETGFKFRAAGYRMANEIGEQSESPLKFEDYNAVRVDALAYANDQIDRDSGTSNIQSQMNFLDAAIHPATGSWGKHWGTGGEFAIQKSGEVSIEQAQVRYVFGEDRSFGSLRGGVFHSIEGFGAADAPIGITRPLIQSAQAFRGATNTLYTLTEPSAAGLTTAYSLGDTYSTFNVFNRIGPRVANGNVEASYLSSSSQQLGDILMTFAYIFAHEGAGSGLFFNYYKGQANIPVDTGTYAAAGIGSTYKNNFHRLSLYSNYYFRPDWNVLGGVGLGRDQAIDPTTGFATNNLDSWGYFLSLEKYLESNLALGTRFDQFRADADTPGSASFAASLFTNYLPIPQVQLIAEYQFLRTGRGIPQPLDQHSISIKATFMY